MSDQTDDPPNGRKPPAEKNRAAAELGRRGGKKGGAARAANMTPEERADAARLAAVARWSRIPAEQRQRRNPDGAPFVFVLWPDEIALITQIDIVGSGGLQSLLRKIRTQLETSNTVEFDNAGLGQLIRYATRIGGGGFETRLRRAFARSFLDLFAPFFEAERR